MDFFWRHVSYVLLTGGAMLVITAIFIRIMGRKRTRITRARTAKRLVGIASLLLAAGAILYAFFGATVITTDDINGLIGL